MKTSQETTSVWNNNQVEPYFFACTNWIYDFLNGDRNMDPKMGPHLSLKTGTEKVKANSRASLFPPHFVIAKTDPKTRPSFGQWPKKRKPNVPIFIRKLQHNIQIENMKYRQSCKTCTTHTPSIAVNAAKKFQRMLRNVLKFTTETKTEKLKFLCMCVYRTNKNKQTPMNNYIKLLKSLSFIWCHQKIICPFRKNH